MPELPNDPLAEGARWPATAPRRGEAPPAPPARRYPRALAAVYGARAGGAEPGQRAGPCAPPIAFVRASAPPPTRPSPAALARPALEQMAGQARLRQDGDGAMAFDIEVNDPELGPLSCTIAVRQGRATAQFLVDDLSTRRLLDGESGRLAAALRDRGLKIDQVDVVLRRGGSP